MPTSIFLVLSYSLQKVLQKNILLKAGLNTVDENFMFVALLQRGYPQVYLDNLSDSAKESLYNKPNLEFEGGVVTTYDEETGEYINFDIPANGIQTRGQIPASDLSLTWGISRSTTSDYVFVTYSYEWNKTPFNRYQDPIAISWDGDCFAPVDGTFYKVDYYTTADIDGSVHRHIESESHNYANGSNEGVSWYADLVDIPAGPVSTLYGHGEIWLNPKKSEFTTIFFGHYVHNLSAVGLSLPIPSYGMSFSVSGGLAYDEIGTQRTYSYPFGK